MNTLLARRDLLAAAGGLVVSFSMAPTSARAAAVPAVLPGSLKDTPLLDAWIAVAADGWVTVSTGKAELGQGLKTALVQIAAEQLDVGVGQVTIVTADTGRTPNEGFTAGSHSMQDSGTAILHAAAQVRALLCAAAAAQFGVPADTLTVKGGWVSTQDGRNVGYGTLAAGLSLHVQAQPASQLKDPAAYHVIGQEVPRIDIPAKVTGGPAYVQDLRPPGMLHARVVRQPSAGAVLREVDTGPVERMKGVVQVVREGDARAGRRRAMDRDGGIAGPGDGARNHPRPAVARNPGAHMDCRRRRADEAAACALHQALPHARLDRPVLRGGASQRRHDDCLDAHPGRVPAARRAGRPAAAAAGTGPLHPCRGFRLLRP
jgi:CO/xanthine dehydrogenase Mo-binding subunit